MFEYKFIRFGRIAKIQRHFAPHATRIGPRFVITYVHIGPSSVSLSNAQAPVVPSVAHSCWKEAEQT